MSRYVVGVDGGNTKTHYALFDESGTLVSFLARGTASHEALPQGYDAMEQELARSFKLLLAPQGLVLDDVAATVLGLAGTDTPDQHREISRRLRRIGLGRFRLVNDAFLGIKAGTPRGVGVCSVNGTGTVAAAVNEWGETVQVGGHGYVSGDEGGGYFLAERSVRAVYDAHFRCGPETTLTSRLLELCGLSDVSVLVQQWMARRLPVLEIAKAAFEEANAGDSVARGLIEAIGRNAADSVLGAVRLSNFSAADSIDIVLAGSLYVKAASHLLIQAFENSVKAELVSRARFHVLQEPPVCGAVLWALEDLSGPPVGELRRRVLDATWPESPIPGAQL